MLSEMHDAIIRFAEFRSSHEKSHDVIEKRLDAHSEGIKTTFSKMVWYCRLLGNGLRCLVYLFYEVIHAAGKKDLVIEQGAEFALTITYKVSGAAVDLTDYSAYMQVRETKEAATAILDLNSVRWWHRAWRYCWHRLLSR
jgi:predicted Kef-type K+ transport protein